MGKASLSVLLNAGLILLITVQCFKVLMLLLSGMTHPTCILFLKTCLPKGALLMRQWRNIHTVKITSTLRSKPSSSLERWMRYVGRTPPLRPASQQPSNASEDGLFCLNTVVWPWTTYCKISREITGNWQTFQRVLQTLIIESVIESNKLQKALQAQCQTSDATRHIP